jgi:tRNA(His) 5'-end guanylyltransferase
MKDTFGDRMKTFEGKEAGRRLLPLLPIMARLDGKSFHSFCRGLKRPFDENFKKLMVATTKYLVTETGAVAGYRQSDEITLCWYSESYESQVFFDGRIQKMTSILAAMATAYFNKHLAEFLPEKTHLMPLFDCRVWNVPTLEEAANTFLWREVDAVRNSIQSAGQAQFSHTQLHLKSQSDIQEMLFQEKGINWNDYPAWAKRGSWVRKERTCCPFTATELEKLPAKHQARSNPDLRVERWSVRELDLPRFGAIKNRVGFLFHGEEPVIQEDL